MTYLAKGVALVTEWNLDFVQVVRDLIVGVRK